MLYFDADCVLCSSAMRLVARFDRNRSIRLAALSSAAGRELTAALSLGRDSIVFVDAAGRAWTESDAVLKVAAALPFPWPAAQIAFLVPRFVRDAVYRLVAKNRAH